MTMGDGWCIRNDGRVAQFGEPLEVYRRPAHMFGAGFLGSPPMNLLKGRLEVKSGRMSVVVGREGVRLPLGPEASFAGSSNRDVIVGIRPEDLYESAPSGDAGRFVHLPVR